MKECFKDSPRDCIYGALWESCRGHSHTMVFCAEGGIQKHFWGIEKAICLFLPSTLILTKALRFDCLFYWMVSAQLWPAENLSLTIGIGTASLLWEITLERWNTAVVFHISWKMSISECQTLGSNTRPFNAALTIWLHLVLKHCM